MEEQAAFSRPNKRSPQYDIELRNAKLDAKQFPVLRRSGRVLFDRFDRRYNEGLDLILCGAKVKRNSKIDATKSRVAATLKRKMGWYHSHLG